MTDRDPLWGKPLPLPQAAEATPAPRTRKPLDRSSLVVKESRGPGSLWLPRAAKPAKGAKPERIRQPPGQLVADAPPPEPAPPPATGAKKRRGNSQGWGWGGPARGARPSRGNNPHPPLTPEEMQAGRDRWRMIQAGLKKNGLTVADYRRLKGGDKERADLMRLKLAQLALEAEYESTQMHAADKLLDRLEGTPVSRTQQLGADGRAVDPSDGGRPVFIVKIEG